MEGGREIKRGRRRRKEMEKERVRRDNSYMYNYYRGTGTCVHKLHTCVHYNRGLIFLPNSNCAFWYPPSSGSLLKN